MYGSNPCHPLTCAAVIATHQNAIFGENKVAHAGKELIVSTGIAVEVVFHSARESSRYTRYGRAETPSVCLA